MPNITLDPREFRPAFVEKVTGWSADQIRDLRKRKYSVGGDGEGWLAASPNDLAKLMLLRVFRDAKIELSEAWKLCSPDVIRNIVFHAAVQPGVIADMTETEHFKKYPSHRIKYAAELSGAQHHAGGDYYIFGPKIRPNVYTSIKAAIDEGAREFEGERSPMMTVISLRELSNQIIASAGHLGTLRNEFD